MQDNNPTPPSARTSVRLPAVAAQLVLNERYRAMPEGIGARPFPVEGMDSAGNLWTVGTQDRRTERRPKAGLSDQDRAQAEQTDAPDELFELAVVAEPGIVLTRHPARFSADTAANELLRVQERIAQSDSAVRAHEAESRKRKTAHEARYAGATEQDAVPKFAYPMQAALRAARQQLATLRADEARLAEIARASRPEVVLLPLDLSGVRLIVDC